MAEEEEAGQKRRYSTRNRETANKRQAIEAETPKPKETPKSTPTRPPGKSKAAGKTKGKKEQPVVVDDTPPPKIDVLPSKLVDGKPFPTVKKLPKEYGSEYQTVKESGVLAAALARSRRQWTTDGVFEKYWTKPPPKKKGEPPQPRERGRPGEKVGQCQLMVEPHIFDISFYIVKQNIPHANQPQQPQYYQYAPSHGQPHGVAPKPQPPQRPPNQPVHQPQRAPYRQDSTPQTPHTPNNPRPIHNAPNPAPQQQQQQQQQQQSQANTPDPVIQMLAQRASTNPELKSVMKIVATGTANQNQLDYFQKHIDELNRMVREQQRRSAQSTPAPPPQKSHQPNGGSAASPTPTPGGNMVAPHASYQASPQYAATPSAPSYGPPPAAFTPQPYYPPQQPPRYAPAAPHPQNVHISALLIEFALDSSSRFLFPPNAILEYQPGFKSCTASFLIKRKAKHAEDAVRYIDLAKEALRGREIDSKDTEAKKPEEMDFWQPVTVRFQCDNPTVLQIIGRVVKPAEEVKAWMEKMLNGEPDQPKADVKAEGPKDANTKEPNAAATADVKEEPKENSAAEASENTALPVGVARAESRRLALRLPKEDKGKENVE